MIQGSCIPIMTDGDAVCCMSIVDNGMVIQDSCMGISTDETVILGGSMTV